MDFIKSFFRSLLLRLTNPVSLIKRGKKSNNKSPISFFYRRFDRFHDIKIIISSLEYENEIRFESNLEFNIDLNRTEN